MIYFLDTNICSYFLDDRFHNIREKLRYIPTKNIQIPSIVAAEMYYGAKKSAKAEYNLKRIEEFLSFYKIVRFDDKSAKIYGDIRADLEKNGQIIGGNDIIIASIVLSRGGILVTHNVNEFARVKNLKIEDWTE